MCPRLNLELIEEKTGIDDVELLVVVAEALAEEGPVRIAEIEQGLAENDAKKISIGAHTLKGACKAMAMMEVAQAAEAVEMAVHDKDFAQAAKHLQPLKEHVSEMVLSLQQFMEEQQNK